MSVDKRITELETKLHERRVENDNLRREMHGLREEIKAAEAAKQSAEVAAMVAEAARRDMESALRELVTRCDGAEGVQEDGSNISTLHAHAVLGDFAEVQEAE